MSAARGRGRPRGGGGDRRAALLTAARARFAAHGYDASVRQIAEDAGVDPALVAHHFGNKQGLFVAALDLPIDPRAVIESALAGGLDGAAERLLRAALAAWAANREGFAAVVRSGLTESTDVPDIARHLIFPAVRSHLDGADADLRAALVAAMMIGLGLQRHVLALEPVATADADEVVRAYAPALQALFTPPQIPAD